MQIVLDSKGLTLRRKRNSFYIESDKSSRTIAPSKVSSIAITSDCVIHANAIRLAVKNQIPILIFDRIGKAEAMMWSPYFESIATLRRRQVQFAESAEATKWIIQLFELKTEHQIANLQYLQKRRPALSEDLGNKIVKIKGYVKAFAGFEEQLLKDCANNLMGTEGNIARTYWQSVSLCLPEEYQFEKRSRQPAQDKFNAALNYLYGMTYTVVESAIFAAGLDPHLGLLHSDAYRKATLSFDLIEPFRAWIDRLLIDQCIAGTLKNSFFTSNKHGTFLNKNGKAFIIPMFNKFMRDSRRFQQKDLSNRNQIYSVAKALATKMRTFTAEKMEEEDGII